MTKGQEESDDLVVPKDCRKAVPTAVREQGGKEVTASKAMEQLELIRGTADSPKGSGARDRSGPPDRDLESPPKPRRTTDVSPSAMTLEEIADTKNLTAAFMKVASNKGAAGSDGQSIAEVRQHFHELLPKLSAELLQGSYRPGNIRRVWIPKPGGGQRGLGIPNVVDRIVQQAVHNVLGPQLEPKFHDGSHGFRPKRSCHTAIAAAKHHLEQGCAWVVDIDLEKFFDRVHHERLLAKLEHMGVLDTRVIALIRKMLKAKVVMPDGVIVNTENGTPQGGPLSPLLSNVVLDELDRELERRGHRFVRYADDCNIYVRSERAGQRVMASISTFIERRLRLTVNREKSAVARPSTRHFLGFTLRRSKKGSWDVLLSERSKERIARRVVELTPRNWGGSLISCIKRINEFLVGWIEFFAIVGKAEKFKLGLLDAHIRRRLRSIVFRQKKRRRFIVRWLQSRRVSLSQARWDVYGRHRSLWALSITKSAHEAMSSYWFDRQGLIRLERRWHKRRRGPPKVTVPAQLTLGMG